MTVLLTYLFVAACASFLVLSVSALMFWVNGVRVRRNRCYLPCYRSSPRGTLIITEGWIIMSGRYVGAYTL